MQLHTQLFIYFSQTQEGPYTVYTRTHTQIHKHTQLEKTSLKQSFPK